MIKIFPRFPPMVLRIKPKFLTTILRSSTVGPLPPTRITLQPSPYWLHSSQASLLSVPQIHQMLSSFRALVCVVLST